MFLKWCLEDMAPVNAGDDEQWELKREAWKLYADSEPLFFLLFIVAF